MAFNRLLDYRPLEFLEEMDDEARFALLHQLLQQQPAPELWRAVLELFASWPESDSQRRGLDVALDGLAAWDDSLRTIDSGFIDLYHRGRLAPLARLARRIEIYRRQERGSSELLAIVESEYVTGLSSLSIVRSEIGSAPWRALLVSPHLAGLRHLEVIRTILSSEDLLALFASPCLTRLQSLQLIDVGLHGEILQSAPRPIAFGSLRHLDLSRNVLGDRGILVLAQSPSLASIQRLGLRETFGTSPALSAILRSPYLSGLKTFEATGNKISAAERAALSDLAREKNIQLSM